MLNLPVAAANKQRLSDDEVVIDAIVGDVDSKNVIIICSTDFPQSLGPARIKACPGRCFPERSDSYVTLSQPQK